MVPMLPIGPPGSSFRESPDQGDPMSSSLERSRASTRTRVLKVARTIADGSWELRRPPNPRKSTDALLPLQ